MLRNAEQVQPTSPKSRSDPFIQRREVIERTIHGALDSDYPNLHVVSSMTAPPTEPSRWPEKHFARKVAEGRVVILTKPNSGNSRCSNFGLEHIAMRKFLSALTPTLIIAPDAITRLVPHFLNPKVGAVAGNAKVGNRVNLWTRWQALEYITSQNFERRALTPWARKRSTRSNRCMARERRPRRRRFSRRHRSRDADLTMALLRDGYRVEYEDQALAFTEAPHQRERTYAPALSLVIRNFASRLEAP